MRHRARRHATDAPISIYEMHAASWFHPDGRIPTWDELAERLVPYVSEMGFSHIELMPVSRASVRRLMGLSAAQPVRAECAVRSAGRFRPLRRCLPPRQHRRDRRLGAGAFPDRCPRHGAVRWHGAVRTRGPARGVPSGLEHLHLQCRPPRGAGLPDRVGSLLAGAFPRRRPARRCGGLDAVSRLFAPRGSSGSPTCTAAARTWRRSASCATSTPSWANAAPARSPLPRSSTAWPGVSRPISEGGLGFAYKWNMGWMHDTLRYMEHDADPSALASQRHDVRPALCLCREFRAAAVA